MCKTPRATALLACLCAATSCVSVDTLSPAAHAAAGRLLAFAPAGLGPHGGLGFLGGGAARWEHDPMARCRPQPWGPRAPGAGPRRRLRRDRCWDAQRSLVAWKISLAVILDEHLCKLLRKSRTGALSVCKWPNSARFRAIYVGLLDRHKRARVPWRSRQVVGHQTRLFHLD